MPALTRVNAVYKTTQNLFDSVNLRRFLKIHTLRKLN